jgi:hypothetical protein
MENRGVIYAATGARHLREARCSAQSVKTCMPQVPITLFTDQPEPAGAEFDSVGGIADPKHDFSDKILPLLETPYEKTLYLDTDTHMCASCESVFLLLDRYDLLAAHDPWRSEYSFETLPDCFPTLNSGVIAYRKSPEVEAFIRSWHAYHRDYSGKIHANDQPAFRHALYHSNLKFFVLPSEFNLRTYYPCFVGGFAKVKIIHDRNRFVRSIASNLNRFTRPRIYGYMPLRLLLLYYAQKTVNVSCRLARKWFPERRN